MKLIEKQAERLSRELRQRSSGFLRKRRGVVGLSLVSIDVLLSAKLTLDQATKHRAFCAWCLTAAGATFAALPLVIPEARAALRRLRQGR